MKQPLSSSRAFVVGYDPGGNGKHGVAVLEVRKHENRWRPVDMQVSAEKTLDAVLRRVDKRCDRRQIVAAGIDTLTEWNSGRSGWRPADRWLRETYPAITNTILSSNSLYGSMTVNGAAFLMLFRHRFRSDATMVTEAHPKACYYASTGKKGEWPARKREMIRWLIGEIGIDVSPSLFDADDDHRFDAGVAVLAALRGRNGDWSQDLHILPQKTDGAIVRFFGRTHYWWPSDPLSSTGAP
jgi:hypothetical protein